jgi:hypothetical protein
LGASDPYYAEFQTTAISNQEEVRAIQKGWYHTYLFFTSHLIQMHSSPSKLRRPGMTMESLYDVFSAIRDDEGDHVGTMEACLDPTVAKLSPSLERKALLGIVTATAVALFLGLGETGGEVNQLVNVAVDDSAATTLVDAAIAGIAGLASQLGQDAEEGVVLTDLFEMTVLPATIREFVSAVVVFLSRIL